MANPFLIETYTRTVHDPRDGEEWRVTFRPLNAGDRAAILDQMQASADGDDALIKPQMGTSKLLTVQRAIVEWTMPQPYSADLVAQLHPDIFDQLFEHVQMPELGDAGDDPLAAGSGEATPSEPASAEAVS